MSSWALSSGFMLLLDTTQSGGSTSTDWTDDEKAQIRYRLGLDGTTSTPIATPTLAYASQVDALEGDVTAIKAKTDSLTFTVAGEVNANTRYIKGQAISGSGSEADPWGP